MKYLLIAMRPYQWIKNFFIFLPLVFGQKLSDAGLFLRTLFVFLAFSLVASAMYLINDIIDLEQDSLHSEKRHRPIASGKITFSSAIIMASVLIVSGLIGVFVLDRNCGFVFVVYIFLNYLYMRFLKKDVIMGVFCIGAFFYIRILIGGLISRAELSNWIIICAVLLALFLALNKRRYDLGILNKNSQVSKKYSRHFIDRAIIAIASSVAVAYALYAMDAKTIERFRTDHLIYTVPFVFYGVSRYLYIVDIKGCGGDPTEVLIYDHKMQLNLAMWIAVSIGVIYFKF